MITQTVSQYRNSWFAVFAGMALAPFIYAYIARMLPHATTSPELPTLRTAFIALAALQLALGAMVLLRARAPAMFGVAEAASAVGEQAAPAQFQVRSVLGMAMFEAVSVYGFLLVFLGGDPGDCVYWGAVTLIGMLGVALPVGVAYWRDALERDSIITPGST
jgi:putative Ca2+/H+ antiporter (TMEM165/GDT1 family)